MSGKWKPGTVALVTGIDGELLAFRQERQWATLNHLYFSDWQLQNVRPLVAIDPEDREQVERLSEFFWAAWSGCDGSRSIALAEALSHFANPTPPKPEEPQGLGAVVEDADEQKWILVYDEVGDGRMWAPLGAVSVQSKWREWDDIAAATVLSDGIRP